MRLVPRLDGGLIDEEALFEPTAADWARLSDTCPEPLLDGDRDELTRLAETYRNLKAGENASVLASQVSERLASIAEALARLQATLAFPQPSTAFDVANVTESLMDEALQGTLGMDFDKVGEIDRSEWIERSNDGPSVGQFVTSTSSLAQAVQQVQVHLTNLPTPKRKSSAKDWLYEEVIVFFELKPWSTSHRCDNVEPEAAPALTRFIAAFLTMADLRPSPVAMASLGRDIARVIALRTERAAARPG